MPVAFDTTGMERHDERTWFDPRTGDQVSLTYIGLVPDIPAPLDDLPQLRRKLAEETAETGSIIEAHVVSLDGVPALFQLIKLPIPGQDTGLAFIAAFTVPRAECSVVLRIQCAEEQTTGLRESTVAAQVGFEHCFPPHPYAAHVHGQLPYSLADEAAWDHQFPDHPLTRARSWAHHMLATARMDPRFVALPPFHFPQADEPTPTAEATMHMRPVSLAEPPPVEVAPDPHFRSEPRFQPEPVSDPWFQAEPTPQPEPWLHPEPTFQAEPAPQFHAEPSFLPEPAPQPEPELHSEPSPRPEPVSLPEHQFHAQPAFQPEPQSDPPLHIEPPFQPEPDPRLHAEPRLYTEPMPQPAPLFRSEPAPPEPTPRPEPELHSEPSPRPEPVSLPEHQFHAQPAFEPEPAHEPPLHTEPATQPEPEPLFHSEPPLHAEPVAHHPEPPFQPEPEVSSEAEAQAESPSDAVAQPEPEPAAAVEPNGHAASPLDSWAAGSARHSAEPADDEPESTSARHSSGRRSVKSGDTLQTVLVGLPLAGYLPLWMEDGVTYWRMKDPDAVRARLGTGVESRSAVDTRRYREAAMFSPSRGTLFLMDRFRDDSGHLGGTSTQLEPATEDEAYAAVDDRAISELYVWLGEVVLASVQRGEFVAVETGGWDVPLSPVLLIMLRTDGREWHSVVEASPVPLGAPVWRDQQPVDGNTQVLASPATDQTVRASGLLTRFAVAKWGVHPFQLGLSFGPNPTL